MKDLKTYLLKLKSEIDSVLFHIADDEIEFIVSLCSEKLKQSGYVQMLDQYVEGCKKYSKESDTGVDIIFKKLLIV